MKFAYYFRIQFANRLTNNQKNYKRNFEHNRPPTAKTRSTLVAAADAHNCGRRSRRRRVDLNSGDNHSRRRRCTRRRRQYDDVRRAAQFYALCAA